MKKISYITKRYFERQRAESLEAEHLMHKGIVERVLAAGERRRAKREAELKAAGVIDLVQRRRDR